MWPRQIPLWITVFEVRLRNVLNTSETRVNNNSLTWWYFLKMSWRHFEDVLKTLLQEVLKKSWKCLEDVLARHLEDVLQTFDDQDVWPRRMYWSWPRRPEDVLKTSPGDVWLRRIYLSWSRRLEDVFIKMNVCGRNIDKNYFWYQKFIDKFIFLPK